MFSLAQIRDRLVAHAPVLADPADHARAAVALVLCDEGAGPEVLFIERSEHEQDPWSGHLGFPGGKVSSTDPGPREAAERETWEEVGLDLTAAEYLGRLDDLNGAHFRIVVSCFAFGLRRRPALTLDPREVSDAFWSPLAHLLAPERRREKAFRFRGEDLAYPAVQLLDEGRPWLWGITYRFLAQFLEVMGQPMRR